MASTAAAPPVPARPGRASTAELRAAVRGDVVTPADHGYDEVRALWNGAVDRSPALVVRCAGTADVVTALGFARSEGLPLAVRSGGHSIAGLSSCDGGLVVDLSRLKGVHVDPDGRRAVLDAGLTWGEVDHETQAHGLAVTGGLVSTTGVAGYTLGGGIGWLARRFGLACDHLLAADVVTADGRRLRTDEHTRPELLWALRGGGGAFAIVTSLELRLHPLAAPVLLSRVCYPVEDAPQVLRAWRDAAAQAPDEQGCLLQLTVAPPAPSLPAALHGRPVVVVASLHSGRADRARRDVAPMRALARPLADVTEPMAYTAAQSSSDDLWSAGAHNYFTSLLLEQLPDALLDLLVRAHASSPGGRCELHLHRLGGAVARTPAGATAFAHRTAAYALNVIARAPGRDGFAEQVAWARGVRDAVQPSSVGSYANWLGAGDDEGRRHTYPAPTRDRLAAVHDHYDPTGLFRSAVRAPGGALR